MSKVKELADRQYLIYVIFGLILFIFIILFLVVRFRLPQREAWQAIPPTTSAVMAWPDARDALFFPDTARRSGGEAGFPDFSWLAGQPALQRDLAAFRQALSRLNAHGAAAAAPLILFLQPSGPEGPAFGAILPGRGRRFEPGLLAGEQGRIQTSVYRGETVYRYTWPGGGVLAAAVKGNRLLLGRFAFLVEEMIGQLEERGAVFPPARRSGGMAEAGISLWLENRWLNEWWGDEFWPAGWLHLRVQPDTAHWRLQAAFQGELPWLKGAAPGRPDSMLAVLPTTLSWLRWRCVSLPGDAGGPPSSDDLLRRYLWPALGPEQALAATGLRSGGAPAERFWIVSIRDAPALEARLDSLGRRAGLLEDYIYQTHRIRRPLAGSFRPPDGAPFVNPYCVQLGNYLVLADTRSGLELWIDQYLVNNTLANEPSFLLSVPPDLAPVRSWWLVGQSAFRPLLASGPAGLFRAAAAAPFPWVNLYWEDETTARALWPRMEAPRAESNQFVWRAPLAAPVRGVPQVIEGKNPGVVVVDQLDNIYRLDPDGTLRWRRQLEETIISGFSPLDYYRDGKRQLAFNTTSAIHLVDWETGEEEGNFPLALQTPAVNALTVVDFTGRGDYHFFVAAENEAVYGFDERRRPLPGWNPRPDVGRVTHPLLHFQEIGKDYLVALNDTGALHVFSRGGDYRFPPIAIGVPCGSPPDYQLEGGYNRIIAGGGDGRAYIANLAGEHFSLLLQPGTAGPLHFAAADVTGDARKEYAALRGPVLTLHGYAGTRFRQIFRHRFDHAQTDVCAVRLPGRSKALIGTVDAQTRQIRLLDPAGNLLPGFPLAGSTPFTVADLFGDGRSILLTGDGESVYAYEIQVPAGDVER